jgi:hypothetical protein
MEPMTTTTKERTLTADDTFARLLTAGADSLAVRKANPGRYWAHRGEGEPAAHYFWEEVAGEPR